MAQPSEITIAVRHIMAITILVIIAMMALLEYRNPAVDRPRSAGPYFHQQQFSIQPRDGQGAITRPDLYAQTGRLQQRDN